MKRKMFNSLMSVIIAGALCTGSVSSVVVSAESWAELPETTDESFLEDAYVSDEEYYEEEPEVFYDEAFEEVTDFSDETEYMSDDEVYDASFSSDDSMFDYQEGAEETLIVDDAEEALSMEQNTLSDTKGTVTLIPGGEGFFYLSDENDNVIPDPETEKNYTGETGTTLGIDVQIIAKTVRKKLIGWSTEEGSVEALSLSEFVYPEDSMSLYAVYGDRGQIEGRDIASIGNAVAFTGINTLDIGQNQIAILTFVPIEDGDYIFSAAEEDNAGTVGYLYENGICLARDEAPADGNHFEIKYELKAGMAYELGVAYLASDTSGTIQLNIEKEGTEISEELITEDEPEWMTATEEAAKAAEAAGSVLRISKEPENVVVEAAGDRAVVTVEAAGDGLTYQWYYMNPGAGKFLASSNKSAEYSASVTERINGRKIYCEITDSHGNSVTSKTVSLSIKKALEITRQPEDAVVNSIGEKATVTVEANGSDLTYQWYYKNSDVKNFLVSSVEKPVYTVAVTNRVDGREVYCVITDALGNSVTTNTVTIGVGRALKIIRQPIDGVVDEIGEKATVSVEAEGNGLSYQWYYQNTDSTIFLASSKKTAEYTVTVAENVNGRKIYCEITDANGEKITTDTVSIYVKTAIEIKRQPESVYADEMGEQVTLSVEAEGTGLVYQWYYKNKNVSNFLASSTKTDTYKTTLTAKTDGRQVYCEITDAEGNKVISDIAEMWVYTPMAIKNQPKDVEVTAIGEKAEVSVEAEGTGLTYQWYYKNKGVKKFLASSSKKAVYSVAVTEKVNGRQVYCEIADIKGNIIRTDTVSLMVSDEINIEDVIYKNIDGVMTVIGYVGSAADITVQEKVGGKTVAAIGAGAFEEKTFIKSIDLPDTIEVIGARAFKGCTGLNTMN